MVMEPAPPAALEMVEPELVLELLIVALDAPAQLGEADEGRDRRRRRQGREPILRGLRFVPRPLDQHPLLRPGRRALLIAMGGPHTQPREAGTHRTARAFAPRHRPPRRRRKRHGQLLETLGSVRRGAPHARRRPAATLPALRRPRRLARRPRRRLLLHADDVRQPRSRERFAKRGRVAVAGIRDHWSSRHVLGLQGFDLSERDLPLRLERDVVGHAGGPPPPAVARPALRQVELIGDRQAHRLVRHRHTHRHLAVVLFAQDAAVLPGHAHRVLAFLGKPGVIHDPRGHGAMPDHRRQYPRARDAQHRRGMPGRIGDEVVHRLVAGANMPWIDARRHRLDALALPRQAQAGDVRAQRLMAIPVAEGGGETLHIRGKSLGTSGRGVGHASMLAGYPINSLAFFNTVVLGVVLVVTLLDWLFPEFKYIRILDRTLISAYILCWLLLYWSGRDFFSR